MLNTALLLFLGLVVPNPSYSQGLTDSTDFQKPPDPCRIVYSPSQNYRILIKNEGFTASLSLEVNDEGNWLSLWNHELNHRIGPRYAFIGESGSIVLVDEWINVFSPVAITVINAKGKQVAVYSTDEIARFLNIPRKELAHSATVGPWMQGAPFLRAGEQKVVIPMTELELLVDMPSGRLMSNSTS